MHVKVFLAALLIQRFPTEVFHLVMGEAETRLIEAANSMMAAFDVVLQGTSSPEFPKRLETYTVQFCEWKLANQERQKQRIKNALTELYIGMAQEPLNPQLQREFEQQIERLRAKLDTETLREFDAHRGDIPILRITTGLLSHEHLAHELLLDPTFTMVPHPTDDALNEVWCPIHFFQPLVLAIHHRPSGLPWPPNFQRCKPKRAKFWRRYHSD